MKVNAEFQNQILKKIYSKYGSLDSYKDKMQKSRMKS